MFLVSRYFPVVYRSLERYYSLFSYRFTSAECRSFIELWCHVWWWGGYFWPVVEGTEIFKSVSWDVDIQKLILGRVLADLTSVRFVWPELVLELTFFVRSCDVYVILVVQWNVHFEIMLSLQYPSDA